MAAASTSPPRLSTPSAAAARQQSHATPPPAGSVRRKPVAPTQLPANDARPRDAPVSPVRLNLQRDDWAQPSNNADIELAQPRAAQSDRARDGRAPDTAGSLPAAAAHPADRPAHLFSSPSTVADRPRAADPPSLGASAIEFSHAPLELELSPMLATRPRLQTAASHGPPQRPRNEAAAFRNSRESDESASNTQQAPSAQSSAATSASSLSGVNENQECPSNAESPGSSILEGSLSGNQPVPQFQYHHQHDSPQRARAGTPADAGTQPHPSPEHVDGATPARRHLTPTSGYFRRSSLPRPQSAYSSLSDHGARGRSPNLLPGASHARDRSVQSRKSPDIRPSSYAELLNVPYPQQAPAPLSLDNSNLRTVIGNNASLLSTQKTLEMYRQNVKKTNDFTIQYSFAIFLISTAMEQGLDVSDPKARKPSPQPLRDLDSPVVEGSVTSPYELVREARHILQRLANGGYPFAQYYLADGYASGLFGKGKEDYGSAFPLFVLAAKHGHAESAYRTALCHEFGWGCRKDPAKAVQFLRTAASKRHPGAMTRLGKACLSGDLGEKRYREGIKWLKLAAEAADAQYNAAPYQLGCLYETGYGDDIFQDHGYAAELFTQAADLGHPEANHRMGDAYEHGLLGCPRDPALSVHFYTGAAERGHAAAMMGLCAWYMVGAPPILERDEEEAYEWARRSAELGEFFFFPFFPFLVFFLPRGKGRRDTVCACVC